LLSACGLARALPARADAPEEPVLLDEVVVRSRRAEVSADPTAATTVVEASRFAGEAKGVAELVSTAPGVAVHDYGGLGQLATVSIRGSTSDDVVVLLDGLPLNSAAGGGVDLSTIPKAWISRIEVVRGAEGASYGSGALGGVVNVVTRPAVAGSWSAQGTYGSFGTYSAGADGAVGGERWGLLAAAAADGSGGRFPYLFSRTPVLGGGQVELQRDHNGARSGGLLLKGWAALGGDRIDGLLQLSGGHRELPGWPYAVTPNDTQDDARLALVTRYLHPLGRGLTLSTELSGRLDRLDARLEFLGGTTRQRDAAGAVKVGLEWLSGPSTLNASATVGGERLSADGLGGARSRAQLSAAVGEELSLWHGALRVSPTLRVERVGGFQGWSGKLGAIAPLGGPLALRASAGRTFRVPSFSELYLQQGLFAPNPNLRPEQGTSGDLSLVADGALGVASVGIYAARYDDLIVWEPGSFPRYMAFNDSRALVDGVEAEVATAPLRRALGLAATASYTYLDSQTLRGEAAVLGRELPHRSRHRAYGRVSLEEGILGGHVEVQYLGAQWQDTRNLQPIPSTLTFGAGAQVRLFRHPDTFAQLEVRNLLDDRSLQDGFGYPLPGRMVLATLRTGSP
jgi:iron complex outermembrane receptor protein